MQAVPAPPVPGRRTEDWSAAPTRRLAAWCAGCPPAWPDAALDGARDAFLDTVAVTVAGQIEAASQVVLRSVRSWGSGSATVFGGGGERLAAPWAAFVNGTAAHALDYDDVLDPAMSHPSAALVPAILALGEEIGAPGAACLDAYLVGLEVMARLGQAMNLIHYSRGWHTTLSLGSPGVAASCGRLLGLDAEQMTMALSLSTSMAGGSKRQFGTLAKPMHAGLAAKNGIVAARLAASGMTAESEPFDGQWGYVEMTAGDGAAGLEAALAGLGDSCAMERHGVWQKPYPCCASTHRPVDAIRSLRLAPGDVTGVTVLVSEVAAANLRYRIPRTVPEARFSLPFCIASALADGTLTLPSFSPEALLRPDLDQLMSLVEMTVDPELPGDRHIADSFERGTVEVRLKDGSRLTRAVLSPRGHPNNPMSRGELDAKFQDCLAGRIAPAGTARLLEALRNLDRLDRVADLTKHLP